MRIARKSDCTKVGLHESRIARNLDCTKVGLHESRIARKLNCTKVGLYSRKSFIYKYKTFTLTPFVKPQDILNLTIQNIFYIQLYVESAFMNNPGSTIFYKKMGQPRPLFCLFSSFQTNNTILTSNKCEKVQYLALGFELTTSRPGVDHFYPMLNFSTNLLRLTAAAADPNSISFYFEACRLLMPSSKPLFGAKSSF